MGALKLRYEATAGRFITGEIDWFTPDALHPAEPDCDKHVIVVLKDDPQPQSACISYETLQILQEEIPEVGIDLIINAPTGAYIIKQQDGSYKVTGIINGQAVTASMDAADVDHRTLTPS